MQDIVWNYQISDPNVDDWASKNWDLFQYENVVLPV